MKRGSVILLVSLLALAMAGALGPGVVSAASKSMPKVVLIVGPAGSATDSYRRLANEAAAAAARYTPNVVKVYSPDATWPAVRQALQGASIVVYLGHGNGWPSRYRNSPYPITQNGFGLNPTAGNGNAHQYFGEDAIGREVKLAKNAIVVFSHLCYASGNSEPGLPEGPLEVGQQRVDNYAAGFIRAGASAVIADAYLGPAYYVRSILGGKGSIDRIWRRAPSFNGNLLRFDSLRSKGYIAQMDTDTPTAGFHRSIVLEAGLTSASVLGSATRFINPTIQPPVEPSIAGLGIGLDQPDLAAPPTAGSSTRLTFRITANAAASLPKGLMVGVRWDPIQTDDPATVALGTGAGSAPVAPSTPVVPSTPVAPSTPSAQPSAAPASAAPGSVPASPTPGPTVPAVSPTPAPPPPQVDDPDPVPIDLVSPEVPGEVVAPVKAKKTADGLSVPVKVPPAPGLYRLVATIHQADGVAYDASSQALVPALIVRVTGRLTATYHAPAAASAVTGGQVQVRVKVTNLGSTAWGAPAVAPRVDGAELVPARRATLVARWIDLATGSAGALAPESTSLLPAALAPGASASAILGLTAPKVPGEYLVLIDVVVPGTGSLAVAGVPPALVRVSVSGAPSQTAP